MERVEHVEHQFPITPHEGYLRTSSGNQRSVLFHLFQLCLKSARRGLTSVITPRHIPVTIAAADQSRSCPRFTVPFVACPRKKQRRVVLIGRALSDAICRLADPMTGMVGE
jgi:hypothetical protein